MPDIVLRDFDSCFAEAGSNVFLLLGNGYSIDCWPKFNFESLVDESRELPEFEDVRRYLDSGLGSDFEQILLSINIASKIARINGLDSYVNDLSEHEKLLAKMLIESIRLCHPLHRTDVESDHRKFSVPFLSKFSTIFTTNYDLLLYWSLSRLFDDNTSSFSDGFGRDAEGILCWGPNADKQNIYYLHGALHLFETDSGLLKLEAKDGGELMDIIRKQIESKVVPLFISAGNSIEKMRRIDRNPYLRNAYSYLESVSGPMFVFGHSLSTIDAHIVKALAKSNANPIYVSVLGDDSILNQMDLIARANRIAGMRSDDCKIIPFEARSAVAWPVIRGWGAF